MKPTEEVEAAARGFALGYSQARCEAMNMPPHIGQWISMRFAEEHISKMVRGQVSPALTTIPNAWRVWLAQHVTERSQLHLPD